MLPCSLIEKILVIDTVAQARKKEQLLQKNREAARALLQQIQGTQVSYVTVKKNESNR